MERTTETDRTLVSKYETVFFLFMAVLVFLSRENPDLVYPQILYLFLLLMALNLGAGLSLRFYPQKEWLSAFLVMSNCAAITAILAYSGGVDSNLWVLYVLPIYTACLLFSRREVLLITAGAISFNAVFTSTQTPVWDASDAFLLLLKSAIFVITAAIAFKIVSRDRVARKKLEASWLQIKELDEMLKSEKNHAARAEQLAEVGLVSAGVAHDLNNTFCVILGMTELLETSEDVPSNIKFYLERIAKSAGLGQNIVTSFMGLTKKSKAAPVSCDILEIVNSVLLVLKNAIDGGGIAVKVDFEALPRITGQRTELQRLFLNLFSNALRAMKGGGTLTASGRLAIGPRPEIRQIQITVEDTGPGIPEEVLAKMFKPFSTTKEKEGGTGLGLYICSEIATEHGGRMRVDNKESGGARFTIFLPVP